MKRNSKLFGILLFSSLAITSLSFALNKPSIEANAYYSPSTTYTTGDAATYYSSIDSSSSGDTLLTALRNLNLSRRKSTVGYSAMGTKASESAYIYTDYDPSTVKTDSNGQPYGTSILSFYSGTSTTSWNREHVWPNSRGGGVEERQVLLILMPIFLCHDQQSQQKTVIVVTQNILKGCQVELVVGILSPLSEKMDVMKD